MGYERRGAGRWIRKTRGGNLSGKRWQGASKILGDIRAGFGGSRCIDLISRQHLVCQRSRWVALVSTGTLQVDLGEGVCLGAEQKSTTRLVLATVGTWPNFLRRCD